MTKRIAPCYQVLLVSALQLILTAHVAYTADIKTSKTKIKNYLKAIADTDKKISLTEDKLTVLRSDVENARQDSITRENTFKKNQNEEWSQYPFLKSFLVVVPSFTDLFPQTTSPNKLP